MKYKYIILLSCSIFSLNCMQKNELDQNNKLELFSGTNLLQPIRNIILGYLNSYKINELRRSDRCERINDLTYSPDGKYIAAIANDRLKVWSTEDNEDIIDTQMDSRSCRSSITYSSNCKYLICGLSNDVITIFDFDPGYYLSRQSLQNEYGPTPSLAFIPNSNNFATTCSEGIKICDITDISKPTCHILSRPEGYFKDDSHLQNIKCDDKGEYLACCRVQQIDIWYLPTSSWIRTIKFDASNLGYDKAFAFSPNAQYIACLNNDTNSIGIWEALSGMLITTLQGHTKSIESLVFLTGNNFLVSSSNDNTIRVWDIRNIDQIKCIKVIEDQYYRASHLVANPKVIDQFAYASSLASTNTDNHIMFCTNQALAILSDDQAKNIENKSAEANSKGQQ